MKETDASCSNLIDGKAIAEAVNRETASEVANIAKQYGAVPGLAVVLVGDNPASQVYVNTKVKKCAELGIYSEKIVLPKETTQAELLEVIGRLNHNPTIHGILVQSPPPPQIDEAEIVKAVSPEKDVDCFHPQNVGRMLLGDLTGFLHALRRHAASPAFRHRNRREKRGRSRTLQHCRQTDDGASLRQRN